MTFMTTRFNKSILALVMAAAVLPATVSAAMFDDIFVDAVGPATMTGADLAGIRVTATFGTLTDNGQGSEAETVDLVESVFWSATGATSGGALGTSFSLTQSGDTIDDLSPWTLTNLRAQDAEDMILLAIELIWNDAAPIAAFDIEYGGTINSADTTPGSDDNALVSGDTIDGHPLFVTTDPANSRTAILPGIGGRVGLNGDAFSPHDDLYRTVRFIFQDKPIFDPSTGGLTPGTGLVSGDFLTFVVDTDFVSNTAVVPVPAAAWLFGSGLLGLAFAGRRRAGASLS
jgi:hypothetical protein